MPPVSRIFVFVSCLFLLNLKTAGESLSVPTIPLNEIHRGMEGTWKTVVAGSEIQTFPLRVLGTIENFVGPQRSVIIAEAIDPENILSGPVGGMSGSPVYFDGRLAGAYAYGFLWPKEQAIIGITPISDMEAVFNFPELEERPLARSHAPAPGELWAHWRNGDESWLPTPATASQLSQPLVLPPHIASGSLLHPVPTPLMAAGFSPAVLRKFASTWESFGMELSAGPGGGNPLQGDWDPSFPAGSALAAVMMTGDFSIAATGTVTYNDGNRFLAFGHPFLNFGQVDMPVAPAEILTVVRTVNRSFKLSRSGPITGSLTQDRLPAVAGRLDRAAAMIPLTIRVQGGVESLEFHAEVLHHPVLTGNLVSMALLESIFSTLEREAEQTVTLETRFEFEGLPPLSYRNTLQGLMGMMTVISDIQGIVRTFIDNPFDITRVQSLEFTFHLDNAIRTTDLIGVAIETGRARAGEPINVRLNLLDFRGDPYEKVITVPLPEGMEGREMVLHVADAPTLRVLRGLPFPPGTRTLPDFHRHLSDLPRDSEMVVRLDLTTPGVALGGTRLEDLPPSTRALLQSPRSVQRNLPLSHTQLWENRTQFDGVFRGSHRLPFIVE